MQRFLKNIEFRGSKERLIVKGEVINIFRKYEQRTGAKESGGILLGYVYKNRTEVAEITTPSRFDVFGLTSFIRSRINAQIQVNKAWKKSNGTLIYLGEWHTHSEINPEPSEVDKQMIRKTLKETKMEINFLHLIIVGQKYTYWIGKQTSKKLTQLKRYNN